MPKAVVVLSLILNLVFTFNARSQDVKKTKVFLLAGQSNMDGRGAASGLTKDDLKQLAFAQKRIHFYYKGTVNNGKEPLIIDGPLDVTDPWPFVKDKFRLNKCFGPELFFGLALSKAYPKEKFLFVKRSQGGTSLYGAWNPNWTLEKAKLKSEENKPKLFEDFIATTDAQLSKLPPGSFEIIGMLWVQGESDSSPLPSSTYGQNITALIQKVRAYYGVPDMPFLMLGVGSKKVVAAMSDTSKNSLNVSLIRKSNNPKANNYTPIYTHNWNGKPAGHYNYTGMKKIGNMFFDTYQKYYANFIER
jgi:hypothetical protein